MKVFGALILSQLLSSNVVGQSISFDWAVIGNPRNAPDPETGFGAVDYAFRISKHEVTNAQYVEFLNAVGSNNLKGLYDSRMFSDPLGGIIQNGSSGQYNYSSKAGKANIPVVFISFLDAMRFVNWLENGQPTGAQDSNTTEDGVYLISDGVSEARKPNAHFFIPTEDEWYKAAYHDANTGTSATYFKYPTGTNIEPYSDDPSSLNTPDNSNTANHWKFDFSVAGYDDGYAVTGELSFDPTFPNYLTDVGTYVNSNSPYGTFDQGGNAFEWNEAIYWNQSSNLPVWRGIRGGAWSSSNSNALASSSGFINIPHSASSHDGFRVASRIPEPTTLSLTLAALCLSLSRGRNATWVHTIWLLTLLHFLSRAADSNLRGTIQRGRESFSIAFGF